jgi:NAD(P)H dehydrogenase (quinone)
MMTVAITGVTGQIGGAVAREVALDPARLAQQRDVVTWPTVRLLARDAARAPRLDDTRLALAEYGDTAAVRAALEGVDVVLMVSAAESAERMAQHASFIDGAKAAGVGHIVYTSFVGASPDTAFTLGRDHGATEELIRASGMEFTFLRDNFYLDLLPTFADEQGVIRGPAGDGRMAAVARADVAHVASLVLLDPAPHRGRTYDLTGREAITFAELAARYTTRTGIALRFHDETLEEAYASRARFGAPDWLVEAWVSTYTAIAAGELEHVSGDIERLTGRAARVLEDVL